MICRFKTCGREIPDDAAFCPYCGRKQAVEKLRGKRPNGTGTVYKLSGNRSKPWVAAKSKVILGYYPTKREAMDALSRAVDTPVSSKANYTYAQVYDEWIKEYERKVDASTFKNVQGWYKMAPDLLGKKFRDLRTADFQEALDKAGETRKRSTIGHLASLWSMLYTYAEREGIASRNYAQYIVLPEDDSKHHEPFTVDEIERLIKNDSDDARIVLMLIYTGMRVGELFKVKSSDWNGEYIVGGEKTKAGKNRVIPVPTVARKYFDYFASMGNEMLMPMALNNFRCYRYNRLMKIVGIEGKPSHSCRATFATITSKTMSQVDLQRVLGHKSYETTSKYYINRQIDELVDAVDKAW